MKIALLTDGIAPYVTGGMQRHSFNLCRSLARLGVQVDLYHCDPQKQGAAELSCFTEEEKKFISAEVIPFPDFGKMPGHYIRESYQYSRSIASSMRKKAPVDFIYAKGFTAWELLHLKEKGAKLPPVGVNLHGYEMYQPQPGWKARIAAKLFLRPAASYLVKHADYLFSYGGKITPLIRSLGVDENRIASIPGGIGEEWLANEAIPVHEPIRFLFAGRAERRKGIEELNAALASLMQSKAGMFSFSFLGPVPPSLRVRGNKYFGEIRDQQEIIRTYREHDVLVVPSHSEGMPNVILEAMASGLAIAATDVGAVSSIVSSANGWIIPHPKPASIEEVLTTVLDTESTQVLEKKKASLRLVREEFVWNEIGRKTLQFIEKAVAARGA